MIQELLLNNDFTVPTQDTYYVVTVYRFLGKVEKEYIKQTSVFYFTKSQEKLASEIFYHYAKNKRCTVILSVAVEKSYKP